jgi:hypothetical protein
MQTIKPIAVHYMKSALESMDLTVESEWLSSIRTYFMISAQLADILETYQLDMTEDLAPVFRP